MQNKFELIEIEGLAFSACVNTKWYQVENQPTVDSTVEVKKRRDWSGSRAGPK